MGLSWQQGPLSAGAIGRFLVPEPRAKRLLYAEPLRRRMRVRFGGSWIADSEHVLLLFEPGRYPVAYFPETDISPDALQRTEIAPGTTILGSRPGTPLGQASTKRSEGRGNTSSCLTTLASFRRGSHSPGGPWTPSTRRRRSWATPPIVITASTSDRPPAASWSGTVIASSPIPSGP